MIHVGLRAASSALGSGGHPEGVDVMQEGGGQMGVWGGIMG